MGASAARLGRSRTSGEPASCAEAGAGGTGAGENFCAKTESATATRGKEVKWCDIAAALASSTPTLPGACTGFGKEVSRAECGEQRGNASRVHGNWISANSFQPTPSTLTGLGSAPPMIATCAAPLSPGPLAPRCSTAPISCALYGCAPSAARRRERRTRKKAGRAASSAATMIPITMPAIAPPPMPPARASASTLRRFALSSPAAVDRLHRQAATVRPSSAPEQLCPRAGLSWRTCGQPPGRGGGGGERRPGRT